ncbi:MAG: IS21 family transposase, partial [Actinomycetota bacterium]
VESAVRYVCGRWWRTMSAVTPEQAQLSLDRFLAGTADARERRDASGAKTTVASLADAEPLLGLPAAPYPVTLELTRIVAANATVAFRGNRYSVPPGLTGVQLRCRHRLGSQVLEICSASGALVAMHRLGSPGAGRIVRIPEHHAALESVVLHAFTVARPCATKQNRPPGPSALAEAAKLLGDEGADVTADLASYAELVGAIS